MRSAWFAYPLTAVLLVGCHSESFVAPVAALGPYSSGPDVQLTFNPDQDYWPAWTDDGRGILYSFVDPTGTAGHRCLGILPAAGGTRSWAMCDNRAVRRDTVSSYSAFALDPSGRLLVVESVSRSGFLGTIPGHIRLLLTDTTGPYYRTTLDTIPISGDSIGSQVAVNWLLDLKWTGPNSFAVYGTQFFTVPHIPQSVCGFNLPCQDSVFGGTGVVLTSTIANGRAVLRAVPGTDFTLGYSLAEGGRTVVFHTVQAGNALLKVPLDGGAPVRVASINGSIGALSCRGEACLVASGSNLLSVSLVTGAVTTIRSTNGNVSQLSISPTSSDVVVQIGSNLFLYKGIFP